MKNKYKLMCCIIVFTFLISMLCVPAMAYQISNIMTADTDTSVPVSSEPSSEVSSTESTVSNDIPVYIDTDTSVSSSIVTDTDIYSSTVMGSDTDTQTETDILFTDTDILTDTEIIPEITDTDIVIETDTAEESNTSSEEEDDTPYQGDIYTPLYSTVEDTTRSVITGDTWSNISIAIDSNNEATGQIKVDGNNKGDFSFIKDNKPKNGKTTLYYWLAGGISSLVVGLCGIAFVVVTMLEKNRRMKFAAAKKSKSKFAAGETAEFKLPKNKDK